MASTSPSSPYIRQRRPPMSSPPSSYGSIQQSTSSEQQDRPKLRTRSHSLRHPARSSSSGSLFGGYPSSLLESLDLPKSMWSLRQMLMGQLSEAEEDVKRLQEWTDQSEADTSDQEQEDAEDTTPDSDEEEEVDDVDERPLQLAKHKARRRPVAPSAREGSQLSTAAAFAKSASDFLRALRAELPSLSPSSTDADMDSQGDSPLLQWHMSPDARLALNRFLEDHPLPAFPEVDFTAQRQRASDSAAALLTRVSDELNSLQSLLARLGAAAASANPAAYTPTLGVPGRMSELRDYFASESTRLSHALASPGRQALDSLSSRLHHLRDETSASLHRVTDGASELTALLKDKTDAAMDEASKVYHAALTRGKRGVLLTYEELPHSWRNNQFIVGGYRFIPFEQWGTLLRSTFEWHNETINIHSHLFGFLSLVYLLIFMFPSSVHSLPTSSAGDTAVALLFVFAAMKCLLCSAAWHLLAGCATHNWYQGAACVDYVGISGLIAASVISLEHYGFYCQPQTAMAYMIFSGVCGIIGMVLPWKPWFNDREFKMWRIAFFLSLAGSAATPLAHLAYMYGLRNTLQFCLPVSLSALAYLVGLSFYAHQFPECAQPGRWDNLFASHQLWHFAIVVAVWMHWRALTFWAEDAANGLALSCIAP